jgi:hypothetical protein
VRIGENMGPIDWSYNFRQHFDCYGTSDENRDKYCTRAVERLRTIEQHLRDGKPIRVSTDGGGGFRIGYRVLEIGMYDGWPYWRPTPSVFTESALGGGEWHSFGMITSVYTDTVSP